MEEYEAYLDLLLGDESLMMKHKIERIGHNKYKQRSILRSEVERIKASTSKESTGEGQAPPKEEDNFLAPLFQISPQEILLDKLMIELIENPKKLWAYLSIRVRNAWIRRVVVSSRLKHLLQDHPELADLEEEEFKEKITQIVNSANFGGGFWTSLKTFLKAEIKNCKNLQSLSRGIKTCIRNSFQTYFFEGFIAEEEELALKSKSNKNQQDKSDKKEKSKKPRTRVKGLEDI